MTPVFRTYRPADRDACLAVFTSKVPAYFRAHERMDIALFIDTPEIPYYVLETAGAVIG